MVLDNCILLQCHWTGLPDIGKNDWFLAMTKHNKVRTVHITIEICFTNVFISWNNLIYAARKQYLFFLWKDFLFHYVRYLEPKEYQMTQLMFTTNNKIVNTFSCIQHKQLFSKYNSPGCFLIHIHLYVGLLYQRGCLYIKYLASLGLFHNMI